MLKMGTNVFPVMMTMKVTIMILKTLITVKRVMDKDITITIHYSYSTYSNNRLPEGFKREAAAPSLLTKRILQNKKK